MSQVQIKQKRKLEKTHYRDFVEIKIQNTLAIAAMKKSKH
jgi:hypothetical protein